jgi:hypothetical protein
MEGEARERWLSLCEQAASEQDPERLMELVSEINRILEDKETTFGPNPRVERIIGPSRAAVV